MKSVAILSLLLFALLVPLSQAGPAPQGAPGAWACPDGKNDPNGTTGSTTLAAGISAATTYRVHNTSNDGGVVEVTDASGQVTVVEISGNSSVDVGVPQGGTLKVKDPPDPGTSSPGGTYETV